MRAAMRKRVLEEEKSGVSWGKARTRSSRPRVVHPRVARWAAENYTTMPYFIKTISSTSDYRNHFKNHGTYLALPTWFIRDHYLKLDHDVTLEDAVDGSTWAVSFRGSQGYKDWSGGWRVFSQQNKLHRGYIIVFALVYHSHFLFSVFDHQGCQIIHPASWTKQEADEKCRVNKRLKFHLPSYPKHYSRVQKRLEVQEDKAITCLDVKHADKESADQDKSCRAAFIHNLQQPLKRKFKASATSAAQGNHKICIHMGLPCRVHRHPEQKLPRVDQPVNQTLHQCEDSDLLHRCQKGLEQIQRADCLHTHQPLVEERALMSEASYIFDASDVQPNIISKVAHADPIWFTFQSKRRAVTNVERREAKKAASRYSRTLRRPNSMTLMKESHVYKDFLMELPKSLVLLGGTVEFPQPALTLVDSVGRAWEMQWCASGRHRLALAPKDWALFAVHHFLEEGDACVFEATDIEALTVLVRTFRVVDIPDNLTSIYTHYTVELA